MASIPGARFDITGTTGSSGALTPKSGWKAIVLPRGGHAAQDSTGVNITMDSDDVANRFAVGNWVQVGLSTANIREVTLVGSGVVRVASAVTVSENNRVYLIGNTQPTVSGGSATYTQPATFIRQRDDDAADLYANSLVTSNADGLIQFWSSPQIYDVLIQDGNNSLQGSIIDLPVGAVEGISTSAVSLFGATVTINANVGVTGSLVLSGTLLVGQTTTLDGALGVTGHAFFGSTVTMHSNAGVTGTLTSGILIGTTVTVNGLLGVTGVATFGSTINSTTITGSSDFIARRFRAERCTEMTSARWGLQFGWGSTASITVGNGSADHAGKVSIIANGATFGQNPTVGVTFIDGGWGGGRHGVATMNRVSPDYAAIPLEMSSSNATQVTWIAGVTPSANQQYDLQYIFFGTTGGF